MGTTIQADYVDRRSYLIRVGTSLVRIRLGLAISTFLILTPVAVTTQSAVVTGIAGASLITAAILPWLSVRASLPKRGFAPRRWRLEATEHGIHRVSSDGIESRTPWSSFTSCRRTYWG